MFLLFARELDPSVIGLFALAVAVTEITKLAGAPGLYEAILWRKDRSGADQSAALGLWLLLGVPLGGAALAVSISLSAALGHGLEEQMTWALALVSLRVPLELGRMHPQAALALRGESAALARIKLTANIAAAATGTALLSAGVPELAVGAYAAALPAALWCCADMAARRAGCALHRPRWDTARLREMAPEARAATGAHAAAQVSMQADQLAVAGLLGPVALGHYNLGKRVETALGGVGAGLSQNVFQPMFASGSPVASTDAVRRALALVTATAGAAAAAFAATADALVPAVLGTAWSSAAPAAALLALAGYSRAVALVHTSLLSVTARNGELLRVSLVSTAAGTIAVAAAAPYGATWVAAVCAMRVGATAAWLAHRALGRAAPTRSAWRMHAATVLWPFVAMFVLAVLARTAAIGFPANPLGGSGSAPPVAIDALFAAVGLAAAASLAVGAAAFLRTAGRPTSP